MSEQDKGSSQDLSQHPVSALLGAECEAKSVIRDLLETYPEGWVPPAKLCVRAANVINHPEMSNVDLLRRMSMGALLFLDGRNEHGSHVLMSLPQGLDVSNDTQVAIEEQAEEILSKAEDMGFQIGAHVWARFVWIREEYHHGYFEFSEIDADVTRLFHAAFPGLDGVDPNAVTIPPLQQDQAEYIAKATRVQPFDPSVVIVGRTAPTEEERLQSCWNADGALGRQDGQLRDEHND